MDGMRVVVLDDHQAVAAGLADWPAGPGWSVEFQSERLDGPDAVVARLADAFRARVVDATTESFVFEMTGAGEKLDAFIDLMRPIGLTEVSRTGVVAIARGAGGLAAA